MKVAYNKIIIKLLIIMIAILYLIFLYMDFYNRRLFISSNNAKFISILLCFLISILDGINKKISRDRLLLQAGLMITLMADYLFLIYKGSYTLAIGFFCIVQILYICRYDPKYIKSKILFIAIMFLVITTIYGYINGKIVKLDFIYAMGLFYGICLLASVKGAIGAYKNNRYPSPNKNMILIGMILFLLCDINVAVYNLLDLYKKGRLLSIVYNVSAISMWLYYLPSQVLLSLSGYGIKSRDRV